MGCVISIQKGKNSDAHHAAVSQKGMKNLPESFYSPMPGFKLKLDMRVGMKEVVRSSA